MDLYLPEQIFTLKIALAIAIIRSKPKEYTGKKYTEKLALQYNALEVNWRDKAEELEQQLLAARQQLAQCSLNQQDRTQQGSTNGTSSIKSFSSETMKCGGHTVARMLEYNCKDTEISDPNFYLRQSVEYLQTRNRFLALKDSKEHNDVLLMSAKAVIEGFKELISGWRTSSSPFTKEEILEVVAEVLDMMGESPTDECKVLFCSCQDLSEVLIQHMMSGEIADKFHLNPACILEVLCKHKTLMEQILLKMLATVTTSIEQLELSEKDATLMDHQMLIGLGETLSFISHALTNSDYAISKQVSEALKLLSRKAILPSFPLVTFSIWKLDLFT